MTKKRKKQANKNDENLFREMSYELAGDIGAVDNEDMKNNRKLINGKKSRNTTKKED